LVLAAARCHGFWEKKRHCNINQLSLTDTCNAKAETNSKEQQNVKKSYG